MVLESLKPVRHEDAKGPREAAIVRLVLVSDPLTQSQGKEQTGQKVFLNRLVLYFNQTLETEELICSSARNEEKAR